VSSYAAIDSDESWAGESLDAVLSGKSLLEGDVDSGAVVMESAEDGESTQEEPGDIYTIALHMKENADAAVMGHKISLNVKLVAYQMAAEVDDLNSSYDDIAAVSELNDLQAVLDSSENSANVLLTSNFEIQEPAACVAVSGDSLDGNGKTVTYTNTEENAGSYAAAVSASGGTISNLTVNGGKARALYTANLEEDLFVSDCVLSGAYAFHLFNESELANTGHTVNFTDTVFNSFTVFENRMEHAYFTDCTFNELLKPHGDTTLTNCVITNNFLVLSELKNGETVTLVNCTYNGTEGVNVVITNVDGEIRQEGNVTFTDVDSGKYGIVSNA